MGMRFVIVLVVLLASCTYPDSGPATTNPSPPTDGFIAGTVFVDDTVVSIAESFPMQIFLQVSGELATPCDELVWEVQASPGRFDVTLESRIDPAVSCIAVTEPFDVNIKVGETEGGVFEIYLNGDLVETIDI
jgi:hypothetical protein